MDRIKKVNLAGKTPEEAIALIDHWIADVTDKLNYSISHIDKDNFVEGQEPLTKDDLEAAMKSLWDDTKKLVAKNL